MKDKLWIWGHEAGSHDNQFGITGPSRMTPAEGAYYLGVPNIVMVRYGNKPSPPFEKYALALSPLKRVVWSIVSAGDCTDTENNEVALVCDLATSFTNICGIIMDDFFRGNKAAFYTLKELKVIQGKLKNYEPKLDLWVVVYDRDILNNLLVKEYLEYFDVVTYWTWQAKNIENLEQSFERFEKISPSSRKMLGCYMYDYGDKKTMPVSLMEKQCHLGLRWLQEGRIEGMIFLTNCICDMGLEAVEWTRQWIQKLEEKTQNE